MNTRQHALQLMKVAGYHGATQEFTRLCCENRISREAADLAYLAGVNAKKGGQKCSCADCQKAYRAQKEAAVSVWIDEADALTKEPNK